MTLINQAKSAVLNSLTSADAQRGYRHAIDEFVDWYCSEPRLSFSRTVVLRLGAGRASQDALLQRLDSPEHEQALVFIDNFHRVEPRLLKILTSKLLDANQNQERLIVLLGQPSEAWVLHPTTDVALMSQARATSNYFSLEGVSSDLVLKELDDPDAVRIWESIFGAGARESATIPQIKLAQAVIRDRRDLNLLRIFFVLSRKTHNAHGSRKRLSRAVSQSSPALRKGDRGVALTQLKLDRTRRRGQVRFGRTFCIAWGTSCTLTGSLDLHLV